MPKLNHILAALLVLTFFTCRAHVYTVVIDPGHGGKDFGAVGKTTNEKTVNLDVALLAGDLIAKANPDVDIIYTRVDDSYISLKERADIANAAHGDLFISIHVNSVAKSNKKRATIKGTSVYTLGLHKSAANFEVAKRENSVISLDNDFATSYEGFDPSSAESYIMFELGQNRHIDQSVRFARHVQHNLVTTASRTDNNVRQAGFWVLWATGMPSVLIELDFICNPAIETYLHSDKGKLDMARSIADAFTAFRGNRPVPQAAPALAEKQLTDPVKAPSAQPVAAAQAATKQSPTFHVQIFASARPVSHGAPDFKGCQAEYFRDGKWYKYYLGNCATLSEAKKLLSETRKKFPGAFIVELTDEQKQAR